MDGAVCLHQVNGLFVTHYNLLFSWLVADVLRINLGYFYFTK